MSNQKLPNWARKPSHKQLVVATEKGWTVDSTGEVIVSVRDLDKKLTELFRTAPVAVVLEEKLEDTVLSETEAEEVTEEVVIPTETQTEVKSEDSVVPEQPLTENLVVEEETQKVEEKAAETKKVEDVPAVVVPKKRGPKPKVKVAE